MRIAMIGHKEFPSRAGGVEVVVYELATRLTARGVDVTVYNRGKEKHHNRYKELGVNVVRSFTPKNKSLNAMVYSFVATFHALFGKYDIIHYHAIGPCVPLVIAHIFGRKTVATIHGLNWKVDKWGSFASKYLRLGEKIAAKYADTVITLSEGMRQYFLNTYDRDTVLVKNAVSPIPETPDDIIREKYGLEKGSYVLYIGRLSPEKGIQDLISAYRKSGIAKKLGVAGEAADSAFLDDLRALAGDGGDVMFAGLVSGELMNSLYCNTALYVLPSHTEGLALTLLEALSCGADCLVSNIEENTSVAGKYAETFESGNVDDLADKLVKCADRIKAPSESEEQKKYVSANYGYDRVIDEHMKIYNALVRKEERNA